MYCTNASIQSCAYLDPAYRAILPHQETKGKLRGFGSKFFKMYGCHSQDLSSEMHRPNNKAIFY